MRGGPGSAVEGKWHGVRQATLPQLLKTNHCIAPLSPEGFPPVEWERVYVCVCVCKRMCVCVLSILATVCHWGSLLWFPRVKTHCLQADVVFIKQHFSFFFGTNGPCLFLQVLFEVSLKVQCIPFSQSQSPIASWEEWDYLQGILTSFLRYHHRQKNNKTSSIHWPASPIVPAVLHW